MIDYIYKLNLPPIEDIVIESEFKKILTATPLLTKGHIEFPAEQILKKEWLTIKGIQFKSISGFLKRNATGSIHIDDSSRVRTINEPHRWGINWLYNGDGKMEYWSIEDVDDIVKVADTVGTYNLKCIVSKPPTKTYTMQSGKPYLTNASTPHRATGNGNRYVFSLREKGNSINLNWPQLVEHFQDLIEF